jgi:hypothetical protein
MNYLQNKTKHSSKEIAMAVRKTIKKSDDSKLIRTIPGKYSLIDNADKTNKALAVKRKTEAASRSKKDAKSQKAGLKAANKPLKKTPARTEANRLAAQRAEAVRKKYREGTGPKMTAAEKIARDRSIGLGIPNPPGRLKKAGQAADRILAQANEAAARKAETKKNKTKPRGGRAMGGFGGGIFGTKNR